MSSKSTKRLTFYRELTPDGCSCLSFYDLIRFCTIDQLKKNMFIHLYYPISYVNQHPDLGFYARTATYITYSEFLVYKKIRDILLNDYVNILSYNHQIPFHYIISHTNYKWNFSTIAKYNHTLNEPDLYHPNLIELTSSLSCNKSIPLEWILNHQKKTGKNWDSETYMVHRTFKELVFLSKNHPEIPIDWITVTINNHQITAEDILEHPEYPWNYCNFQYPTVLYYNTIKSRLNDYEISRLIDLMNMSDRNTLSDLIEHEIPITKGIYYNPNLTARDLEVLKTILNAPDQALLSRNRMLQPKMQNFYRKLYGKIVEEIKL